MNRRPTLLTASAALVALLLPAATEAHSPPSRRTLPLALDRGTVEIELVPDRGRSLPLVEKGPNRWAFHGATAALVGQSYSILVRNRTPERLKIVVGVDGLNVYGRDPVLGRSDTDTGSILSPWSDRTLRGWQVDQQSAQRFVFSPPEWSEGRGRTESQIGVVAVHVYRERPRIRYDDRDSALERAPDASRRRAMPMEESVPAPPIGTTSGEDVPSHVRTVRFDSRTVFPEAWAEIDYGQRPSTGHRNDYRLGIDVTSARGGSRIVSVVSGSRADRAGLEPADVIVRLDTEISPSPTTVRRLLDAKRPGDYLFVTVRRGSHELAVKIKT